jgi:hypothetical protein
MTHKKTFRKTKPPVFFKPEITVQPAPVILPSNLPDPLQNRAARFSIRSFYLSLVSSIISLVGTVISIYFAVLAIKLSKDNTDQQNQLNQLIKIAERDSAMNEHVLSLLNEAKSQKELIIQSGAPNVKITVPIIDTTNPYENQLKMYISNSGGRNAEDFKAKVWSFLYGGKDPKLVNSINSLYSRDRLKVIKAGETGLVLDQGIPDKKILTLYVIIKFEYTDPVTKKRIREGPFKYRSSVYPGSIIQGDDNYDLKQINIDQFPILDPKF